MNGVNLHPVGDGVGDSVGDDVGNAEGPYVGAGLVVGEIVGAEAFTDVLKVPPYPPLSTTIASNIRARISVSAATSSSV